MNAVTRSRDERLRRIEAVTDTSLTHLDLDALLVELLDRVRELLGVDTAAVLLLDKPAGQLIATAARGIEEEVAHGFRLPVGEGFAGRIAAAQHPVFIEDVQDDDVRNPVLLAKGIRSLLGVPMIANGALVGVLHVGTLVIRRFNDEDAEMLQMVADRAAPAVVARQADIERAATVALQRALMPVRLPELPGFEFAARYIPGEEMGVGGDWYDVFALPNQHLGVVIGDVVGRGLQAAVVMGRLRNVLRAYALEYDDPATALAQLDRMMQIFEPDTMATALYAIIDPIQGRCQLSVAGHPAPVYIAPGQPARILELASDPPLGAFPDHPRHSYQLKLAEDSLLFFYTDGLVERRNQPISAGLELLSSTLNTTTAEAACASATAALIGSEMLADDVAVLAVHRRHSVVALSSDPH
jgi:sigma-B regulation protein RsbU (phosphoserine phosphatase)